MCHAETHLDLLVGQASIHLADAGQARPAKGLGVRCSLALALAL